MTDLLTPDVVREWQTLNETVGTSAWSKETMARLCQGYLTLWDRNKELEETLEILENAGYESSR